MIFKPELCELILAGKKTQTRRKVKEQTYNDGRSETLACKYIAGKTYAVQPGRGKKSVGRILIKSVERQKLREITQNDAVAEGFPGYFDDFPTDQFFDYWCRLYRIENNEIYSDLDLDQPVYRIEFELVK